MNLWGPNIHVKPDPTDTTVLKTVARMQLGSSISDALDLNPDRQYLQMRMRKVSAPVSGAVRHLQFWYQLETSMSPT